MGVLRIEDTECSSRILSVSKYRDEVKVSFLQHLHPKSMKKGYVYILKCVNGNFYTAVPLT